MARSPAAWESIAKDWLVEVIERTPLDDVEALPVGWIVREAPPLIAEILGQISDPGAQRELTLPPAALERAASLASQRGESAIGRLPRELAALQTLLIEALRREVPERDSGEFARAVSRLAEVFGAVQSAAVESLAAARSGATRRDAGTGLPGVAELYEWIRVLLAEHRRTGEPFTLARIAVEGVERIAEAHGEEAAESMVGAVAGVLAAQLERRDRAFRVEAGELVAVVPGSDARGLLAFARGLGETIETSQSPAGARVAIAVGLVSCPEHGSGADELLRASEEAAWAALAAGELVAVGAASLQDR